MNYQKTIICGNVTKSPELKTTQGGSPVCSFSVAVNRTYTKDGVKAQDTNFFTCVAWAKTAETIAQYVKKGSLLLVEGRLQNRSWEKDGVKRYATDVIVENFQMGPKRIEIKSEEPEEEQIEINEIPL